MVKKSPVFLLLLLVVCITIGISDRSQMGAERKLDRNAMKVE